MTDSVQERTAHSLAMAGRIITTESPVVTARSSTKAERLTGSRRGPYGERFHWGPVDEIHQIGPYTIVEYRQDRSNFIPSQQDGHGQTLFHVYVDGKDAHVSATSLDLALVSALVYRNDGPASRADVFIARTLNLG